jgi:putative thiamine transport system substrate-binding protein
VLDLKKLDATQARLFDSAGGTIAYPAPAIPEPHASWVPPLEALWLERYGA